MDVKIITVDEVYRREPNINKGALGGLLVPGEGILCTFSVPLAYATQAVLNGVELFVNFSVKKIIPSSSLDTPREEHVVLLDQQGNEIRARYIVNAAGLFSDEINAHFGHTNFTVTPRRGQLIVYDKLARTLVNHVLLPVPTSKTKGVLISPTVYGNILLGPTAEDLPDKTATQTTADGFELLLGKGHEILPQLLDEEVTATYSGLRAATEHSDYQIEMHAEQRYLCVGGIRSTGISSAMGIAEYAVELLSGAGLELKLKGDFKPVRMPTIGQADIRPHENAEMIAQNPTYAEMVCHCERVSRGELTDAMSTAIPATTLDGLRRRTRASQGRCQGFNCHAALQKTLESDSLLSNKSGVQIRTQEQAPTLQSLQSCDVLIVGAGPAGLSAAIELKKQGIKNILVVDREPEAGGMPRLCHHIGFGIVDLWGLYTGPRYARHYRQLAEKHDVEIRTSTTITGWKDSKLAFTSPNGLGEIEAKAVLLATGIRERPRAARMVPGTRPQGVFTTGSLQRFVHQEHLPVGKRAVIVGAELVSLSALMTLMSARVKCAGMFTEKSKHQIEFPYVVMKWGLADILTRTPIVPNARVTNIFGHKQVEGIEITRVNNQTEVIECDSVIFTGSWISENEIARLGGLEIDPITKAPKISADFRSSVDGVFVAGNLLRGGKAVHISDQCAIEGAQAGKSIAQFLR